MNDETKTDQEPATSARGNGRGSAPPVLERVAQTAHEKVDGMAAKADEVAAKAPETIERLRASANGAIDAMHERTKTVAELEAQMMESARACVREHPITSVALGVMVGWVLGKFAASRITLR